MQPLAQITTGISRISEACGPEHMEKVFLEGESSEVEGEEGGRTGLGRIGCDSELNFYSRNAAE